MAYQTTSIYKEKVYNEDARHKLKILFNGVEYQDIDKVCEKLTINSRIIPNGNTNFALDNFISKEATLILHNVALEDIVDPVEIQIGTLTGSDSLGDIYEYVPIGIFNIQDIPTTDKDKTTITLRDNAVKFDFPYNAEPLIEGNGGSATKMQIFQDICNQAGVNTNISSFLKDDELFGGYDNTISGRQYIAYLAEQAGAIAIINRYGNLDFIYLNNLEEQEIPLQFVEKYENGDPLEISKVIYESGKIKYEYGEETHDTLFLDASNPCINDDGVSRSTFGEEIHIKDNKENFKSFTKEGKNEQNEDPTPANPIEVNTISPHRKNILNYSDGTLSNNGITATISGGVIFVKGTCVNSNSFVRIPLTHTTMNGEYTLSYNFTNNGDDFVDGQYARLENTTMNTLLVPTSYNDGYVSGFIGGTNGTIGYLDIRTPLGVTCDYVIRPTLEKGSYIPYGYLPIDNYNNDNVLKEKGYATNKTDSNYWEAISGNYITTQNDDGFATVNIDNSSGSGNVFCNMRIRLTQLDRIKAGSNYTAFVEIKNVEKTGDATFILHALDGTPTIDWLPNSQQGAVNIGQGTVRFYFNAKDDLSTVKAIFRSYVRCFPNSKVKCDLRLSIFEGNVSMETFEYKMYSKKTTLVNFNKPNLYDSSYRAGGDVIYTAGGTTTEKNGIYATTSSRNDMYIWEVGTQNANYNPNQNGKLYEFESDTYSVRVSNPLFDKNYVTYYDENKKSLGYTRFYNDFTFRKSDKANAKYFSLRFGYGGSSSGTTYNYEIYMYEGENTTPYYEMCSIGETKDELIIKDGNAKLIKNIDKKLLNGYESWTQSGMGQTYYWTKVLSSKSIQSSDTNIYVICDHFKAYYRSQFPSNTINYGCALSDGNNIVFRNKDIGAVADFKTWLQSNNVNVYYELNNTQEIDLGECEIDVFEGQNDIYSSQNLSSNMEVEYVSNKPQIEFIYDILNGFKINSFKTGKILGNPAIDPYDIISVHDKSVNLFDKDNANIIDNMYINATSREVLNSSSGAKILYIPITGGKTYTVSKVKSDRFTIATTETIPVPNTSTPIIEVIQNNNATSLTLETSVNAKYLILHFYRYSDTLTPQEILDSIQIEEGSVATRYVPYKDETYKTLATNTLTYNGKLIQTFDTQVKIGDKQSNVSMMGEPTFQKYARENIDNINNNIETIVAQQNETTQQMSQVIQTVDSIQNTFQVTGGNNLIKDSQGLLGDDVWTKLDGGNYIMGYDADLIGKTIASAKLGINNGKLTSTSENITGLVVGMQYTLSYKISNDANTTTKVKLTGNNVVYEDTINTEVSFVEKTFSFIAETSTYVLEIESTTTMDGYGYIYDLMLNKGDALSWEPASGEIVGTILKMSQMGLQINCVGSKIATLMTSQGFQVRRYENGNLYEVITEFTNTGLKTQKAETTELLINSFEWKQIRYQYNDTLILYKKESD